MDCNLRSKFVYGLQNGSMIFDVFVRDLILITKHIKKIKFEFFCIIAFIGFYL
jgi:hypothetical protein